MAYLFPKPYLPPIPRSDLEYPTEDVMLHYLNIIGKTVVEWSFTADVYATSDSFTDKAISSIIASATNSVLIYARGEPSTGVKTGEFSDNNYRLVYDVTQSSADYFLGKRIAGTSTTLATESVDLNATSRYLGAISVSGSTLKAFRDDLTTVRITATDTDRSEGRFGILTINPDPTNYTYDGAVGHPYSAKLLAPLTELPKPISIIEYDVIGSGKEDDSFKPDMSRDLVEVSESDVTPEEWEAIQSNPKGANGLPLVDKLAVTWGAIDYKNEPTMLCAIYGGSPSYLDPNRIQKHISYARSKNHKVFKPPKNISEAKALHKEIIKDRKDMLVTSYELAYQLIGNSRLEVDAVSDFYERELINLNRIKRVPTWELHRTLDRWIRLAEKHKRDNAYKKLEKVRRR